MYYVNPWCTPSKDEILARFDAVLEMFKEDEFQTWGDFRAPAIMMDYQDR